MNLLLRHLPAGNNRVDPLPGCLYFVATHEEGGISSKHFHQQALVGIGVTNPECLFETQVQRDRPERKTARASSKAFPSGE